MAKLFLLSALAALCAAQSTADANNSINPSDITALQTPTALAPPVGTQSASASYNSAADVSSLKAALASDAPTQSGIPIPMVTGTAKRPIDLIPTQGAGQKRRVDSARFAKRDLTYPINTKNSPVPSGYTPAFISLNGSTQANGYLTYKTLQTYDTASCAAACNKLNACRFFNIYYEKDPDANNNPVDVIKCSLYSMPQTNVTATNKGQWRGTFHVVITGSNGYNKAAVPVSPDGWTLQSLNGAVDAPTNDKIGGVTLLKSTYLSTYDPALCTLACTEMNDQLKAAGSGCQYQTCVYANLYILNEDGSPEATVCALYTQDWDSYATKTSYDTDNHHYDVSNSIGLTNTALAAAYPAACLDSCAGAPSTCTAGKFELDNWGGINRYNGFYGNNSENAVLQSSSGLVSPDNTGAFIGSGQTENGREVGYIKHDRSGMCLTLAAPGSPTSDVILKPCASDVVPPENQKWSPLYYNSDMRFICLLGGNEFYSQAGNFPADSYVESVWDINNGGGWCLHLTIPEGAAEPPY